jgi:uncharacterized protein YndB with AHSA1/START domain
MRTAIESGAAGTGRDGIGIELRRRFRAAPERVFCAWTEPAALREWWYPPGWIAGKIEIDLRPGGAYRIEMSRSSGGSGDRVGVRGEFLEVIPPQRLTYTWIWESAFAGMEPTLVTVEFESVPDGTLVILRHDKFADLGVRHQHRTGWIAACNRLDRVVTPVGELHRHPAG